jgi:hypothetical protein
MDRVGETEARKRAPSAFEQSDRAKAAIAAAAARPPQPVQTHEPEVVNIDGDGLEGDDLIAALDAALDGDNFGFN